MKKPAKYVRWELSPEHRKTIKLMKQATGIKSTVGLLKKGLEAIQVLIDNGIKIK